MSAFHVSGQAPRMKPFTALRTGYSPFTRSWNHFMVTACTRRVSIWDDCSKTPHSYMRCCSIDTWPTETCPDAGFWCVWEGSLYGSIDHRIHTALCDCLQTVDHIRHISVIAKLRVVFAHVLVNSSEFWMFFGSTDRYWDWTACVLRTCVWKSSFSRY